MFAGCLLDLLKPVARRALARPNRRWRVRQPAATASRPSMEFSPQGRHERFLALAVGHHDPHFAREERAKRRIRNGGA